MEKIPRPNNNEPLTRDGFVTKTWWRFFNNIWERSGGGEDAVSINTPIGSILMFGGSPAPTGWLECDGAAVSRTGERDLFAVIGTTFGVGDGSTTFNLPLASLNTEPITGAIWMIKN